MFSEGLFEAYPEGNITAVGPPRMFDKYPEKKKVRWDFSGPSQLVRELNS